MIVLACNQLSADHALSRYRRTVTHPGRGAGHRRWLRHTGSGMRTSPGLAADASDRPHLLLVVSVALAGADIRTARAGPLTGVGRQADRGTAVSAGLAVLTLRFVENPLRFAAKIRNSPWRSLGAGRCGHRGRGLCGRSAAGRGAHAGRARRAGHAAELHRDYHRPSRARDIAAYDEAVQQAFTQVQAAVAASADLKAVPSNLHPPLADAAAELSDVYLNGCLRSAWQVGQPECASGDTASATTVAWSATRMPRCGIRRFQQGRRRSGTGGWR